MIGIKDVDRLIFKNLSNNDILEVSKINKYTYTKVCDEIFFRNLVMKRYPETIKYTDYVIDNWTSYFLKNIYYLDKLRKEYRCKFKYNSTEISPELEYLARQLNKKPENNKKFSYNRNVALRWAAGNGNLVLVKYLIEKDAKISDNNYIAFKTAAKYGQLEIIKYLIDKVPNIIISEALKWASEKGHLSVVKYLTDKSNSDN